MSLAFHLAHPTRTEALMLFDTGPGYRKDEGREAWNRLADSMAAAYEKKGLAAAGASAEVASLIIAARMAWRMRRAGCWRRRTAA